MDQKIVTRILLILAPTLFWVVYFTPQGPGENYTSLIAFLAAQGLSILSVLVSLYFALRSKNDLIWWLIAGFDLTPIAWIFILPFVYGRP
jgi:hypothetical protein